MIVLDSLSFFFSVSSPRREAGQRFARHLTEWSQELAEETDLTSIASSSSRPFCGEVFGEGIAFEKTR